MCRGSRSQQNQSFCWTPAPWFLANIFVCHLLCPASLEKTVKQYCWTQHRNKGLLSTHTQGYVDMILIFFFPLPPCPEVLDHLVDFISLSCQVHYWHFNCFPHASLSTSFWQPQHHSCTPHASFFNCCHCSWFLQDLPAAPFFLHWAAEEV